MKTWPKISRNLTTTKQKLFSFALLLPWNLPPTSLSDSVALGSHNVPFSDSARNLGFIFGSKHSMKKHVIKICQAAYFQLKHISSIRTFLTEDSSKTLVTFSHGLINAPNSVIQPLQKIQNFAARPVLLALRHHHHTPPWIFIWLVAMMKTGETIQKWPQSPITFWQVAVMKKGDTYRNDRSHPWKFDL